MYIFEKTSYCPCQRAFEGFGWKILTVAPCCQGLATNIHFPSGTSHHPSELLPNPPRRELLNHLPSDTLQLLGNDEKRLPGLSAPSSSRAWEPAWRTRKSCRLQHEVTAGPTKRPKILQTDSFCLLQFKARPWLQVHVICRSSFYF